MATISVRAHWFIIAVLLFELVYRPYLYFGVARYALFPLLLLVLIGFNGYIHFRILSNKRITWRWVFALYALDVFLISAAAALSDGFSHGFVHLFYYPALAGLAVLFASFRLNMVWVTIVSLVYVAISLTVGDGGRHRGKGREGVAGQDSRHVCGRCSGQPGNQVSSGSGGGRLWSASRRFSVSGSNCHKPFTTTAAQSAYMIGLGIDTAKALAGDANPELNATLEATSRLSRSVILELRHPINMGGIYEGRELSRALRSHASSFTNVTSVPVEMTHTGSRAAAIDGDQEPALLDSAQRRSLTHTAMRRRTGWPSTWSLPREDSRLSVSDDGVGLPDDYTERGNGFANMSRAAERAGRASRCGSERRHGRRDRDLRDPAGTIEKGGPGCQRASA